MDKYERAIMDLCYNLDRKIYLPIKEFIRTINTEGETYDLGFRIAKFKGEIETTINKLKELK